MYISNITIKNYGPIGSVTLDMPFNGSQPKPLVLVGQNGQGKSLFLANIVNALVSGRQHVYDDSPVKQGTVFKYRMPGYIKTGSNYSYSCVEFQEGLKVEELQLRTIKSRTLEHFEPFKLLDIYTETFDDSTSHYTHNFKQKIASTEQLFKYQCCLYFPVHRFEEPAWLNIENATGKASFLKRLNIGKISNRNMIAASPLEENRDWLMDLILDREIYEREVKQATATLKGEEEETEIEILEDYNGECTHLFEAVLQLLRISLREDESLRLGIGSRHSRQISIIKNEKILIPNLFHLSTGEIQLLNLFVTILRDFDSSGSPFDTLSDLKGIVVIDEIDTHLHTSHQLNILPQLISSFPGVQFIISTHSPLFLIGLEKTLGRDGFSAITMPTGKEVSLDEFTEFSAAYQAFADTEYHKSHIQQVLKDSQKPIVFVEGDYDIRYIQRAAELLNHTPLLDRLNLEDGGGCGNLDKIWRSFDNPTINILPQKIVLLYDCDTGKKNMSKGQVSKIAIPTHTESPITIGIENLFPAKTIFKIEEIHPSFIDLQEGTTMRVRNVLETSDPIRSVNKDEKGNMCNWLCDHGSPEDFANFNVIFELLEKALESE
ncbi:AAA family ATPase [Pseudomonas sp. zjy_11]|uniref:AAA family ATPase n=1 Tax=Pseudomonas sp. zjy_11 TaxID=3367262 RepID=UPI00370C974B